MNSPKQERNKTMDDDIRKIIEQVRELEIVGLPLVEYEEVANTLRTPIATGLDPDERRWYVITTDVYKVGDSFIGLRGPSSLKSENMSFDDVGIFVEAFEMEAVPSITYCPLPSAAKSD